MEEQQDNHLGHLDKRQGQPESSTTPPEFNFISTLFMQCYCAILDNTGTRILTLIL